MKDKILKPDTLPLMIGVSTLIYFACSSLRHALFHSGAFDLGIYDQVVYLIAQGQSPISSILGFHHLGNHAAWAVYPLGLLYKISPNVHWLLAVQAIALSLGALPIWGLARQAGLKEQQAVILAAVYLLYPVVFNVNLFDFHPEVMALPVLLATLLAARRNQLGWFTLGVIFVLGCKAVLSLTIMAMGVWLLLFERRRRCGAIALFLGVAWFLVVMQWMIPTFSGSAPAAVHRYSYLGDSVPEMAKNLVLQPWLVWERIDIWDSFKYLIKLIFPVIWGLSPRHLAPLFSALPMLGLNILSDVPYQRDLGFQYSIPVVPFLFLSVISTLAAGEGWLNKGWVKTRSLPIIWSFLSLLYMGNQHYFWSSYPKTFDTWQATREAIAHIQTPGGVLTTNNIAPHLSHRPTLKLTFQDTPTADVTAAASFDLAKIDYVLLNRRYPGWLNTPEFTDDLIEQLTQNKSFQLRYQRSEVYLFVKEQSP
jgi:uncharacterized membrane protein